MSDIGWEAEFFTFGRYLTSPSVRTVMQLLVRATAAMLLTGALTPFLVSVAFSAWDYTKTGTPFNWTSVLYIALSMGVVALPSALILGIAFEWPKVVWMTRRGGGTFIISIIFSTAAGLILSLLYLFFVAGPESLSRPLDDGWWIFPVGCFLTGGATSGMVWWILFKGYK